MFLYVSGSQTGLYVPSGVCQRSVGVHETDSVMVELTWQMNSFQSVCVCVLVCAFVGMYCIYI